MHFGILQPLLIVACNQKLLPLPYFKHNFLRVQSVRDSVRVKQRMYTYSPS